MYCYKCGKEAPDNANVCPYCGNSFANNNNIQYNTSSSNSEGGFFKKIASIVSAIGTDIALLLCLYTCTHSDEIGKDVMDLASSILPVYSESIKNDTPPGYNTSLTYGQAFSRYFKNGKWEDDYRNSEPIVRYTGILDNEDGTYTKTEVIFDITDMDNGEFYYNIDTVLFDGINLEWLGVYALMEDVFNISTSY